MTCNEYLALLSTTSAGELLQPTAAEHASRCRDCQRVTQVVIDRERLLVAAYRQLDSGVPALAMAHTALVTARRRRLARFSAFGIAAVFVAVLAAGVYEIVSSRVRTADEERTLTTETFTLRCLTSAQAGELIQAYVRSSGSAYHTVETARGIITVRATEEDLMKTRSVLDRYDNQSAGVCAAPR